MAAKTRRRALSYPSPLWGGWLAEGQSGGVVRLHTEAPQPVHRSLRSRCALPRASFARLDPTRGRDTKERASRSAGRTSPSRPCTSEDEKKRRSRPARPHVSPQPHTQSKFVNRSRYPSIEGRAARGSRSLMPDETQSGFASGAPGKAEPRF
jgi:hypothetical protein